jgi:hypothetical protein
VAKLVGGDLRFTVDPTDGPDAARPKRLGLRGAANGRPRALRARVDAPVRCPAISSADGVTRVLGIDPSPMYPE